MKMSRVISLVLSLCLLAAAVPALADEVPQPEGGKKFETNWAADACLVEIDYEEEGYRVSVTREYMTDPMNLTGDIWQYNCHYDESKDALVSMHSERTPFTVSESAEKKTGRVQIQRTGSRRHEHGFHDRRRRETGME